MECIQKVKYLIIHCSASKENTPYTTEQLYRDHIARGFKGIGYHFFIRRDGTCTQHRSLDIVGAHCKGYNNCSIGICYEGGLRADGTPADTRTDEQKEKLLVLVRFLKGLFPDVEVRGHRDMPGVRKACPCFDATNEYKDIGQER